MSHTTIRIEKQTARALQLYKIRHPECGDYNMAILSLFKTCGEAEYGQIAGGQD